jgi:hypothetical protein
VKLFSNVYGEIMALLSGLCGAAGGAIAGVLIGRPFIALCGAAGGFVGGFLRRAKVLPLKFKIDHCVFQTRPPGVETG